MTHTRVYAVAQYFFTTNGINLLIYHISFGFLPPHSPPSISHWERVEFLCQNMLGLIQPEKPLDMSSTTLRKLSWPEYRCRFALCNRKTYSPRFLFCVSIGTHYLGHRAGQFVLVFNANCDHGSFSSSLSSLSALLASSLHDNQPTDDSYRRSRARNIFDFYFI